MLDRLVGMFRSENTVDIEKSLEAELSDYREMLVESIATFDQAVCSVESLDQKEDVDLQSFSDSYREMRSFLVNTRDSLTNVQYVLSDEDHGDQATVREELEIVGSEIQEYEAERERLREELDARYGEFAEQVNAGLEVVNNITERNIRKLDPEINWDNISSNAGHMEHARGGIIRGLDILDEDEENYQEKRDCLERALEAKDKADLYLALSMEYQGTVDHSLVLLEYTEETLERVYDHLDQERH